MSDALDDLRQILLKHGVEFPEQLSDALQDLFYQETLVLLPPEHSDTNTPSDRLNPQEDGEVIGWNSYRETVIAKAAAKWGQ